MTADSQQGDKREWHTFEQNIPESLVSDYKKLEKGLNKYFPGGIDVTFVKATAHHAAFYVVTGLRESPDRINLQKFLTEGKYILQE